MPFETIVYLTFVISAAVLFAAALTYAEWASKQTNQAVRKLDAVKQGHRHDADPVRKAA